MKKIGKLLLIVIAFLILIFLSWKHYYNPDANKFKDEYEKYNGKEISEINIPYTNVYISNANPMKYASFTKVKEIITKGTGIIYIGSPTSQSSRKLIPIMLQVAKENMIENIYYYNIEGIKDEKHLDDEGRIITDKGGTKEYYEVISLLGNFAENYESLNTTAIKRVYSPTLIFVKNGQIVDAHYGTVENDNEFEYKLTEEDERILQKALNKKFKKIIK